MNLALHCLFSQCYNTMILNEKLSCIILYLLIIRLAVYQRTITRFIADDKVVYQVVRWGTQLASDNCWARRRLKHLSWRSRWVILCWLEWRMAVSRKISRADRCVFGLSSCQSTRSSTAIRECAVYRCLVADGQLYPSCRFSSADCRCFQVSNRCREMHSTAFVHHTA